MLASLKGTELQEGEAAEGLAVLKDAFEQLDLTDEVARIEGFMDIIEHVDANTLAVLGEKLRTLMEQVKDGVDFNISQMTPEQLSSRRLEFSGQLRDRSGVDERTQRQTDVLTARISTLNNNLERLTKVFNQKIGAPDNAVFEEIARKLDVGVEGLNLPDITQGGGEDVQFDVIGQVLTLNKDMIAALDNLDEFAKLPKKIQDSIVRAVMQTLGQTGDINPLTGEAFDVGDTSGLDTAMERVKEVMDKQTESTDVDTSGLEDSFQNLSDAVSKVTQDFNEFDAVIKLPNSMSNLLDNLEGELTADMEIDAEKIKQDLKNVVDQIKENFDAITSQEDPQTALQLIQEFKAQAEQTRERLDAIKDASPPEIFKQVSRDLGQVKRQLTLLTKKLPDMETELNVQAEAIASPTLSLEDLEAQISTEVNVDTSSLDDFDWAAYGEEVGQDISAGLEAGLSNEISTEFAQDLIDDVRDEFEIRSPSKVFEKIGKELIAGLNEGLKAGVSTELEDQINNLINTIKDKMRDLEGIEDIDLSTVFSDLSTDDLSLLRVHAEQVLSQVDWDINWDILMRGLDDSIAANALDALDDVEDRMHDIRALAAEVGTREFSDEERQTLRQGVADFGIVDATGTE
jgi:gas vesicle protein